MLFGCQPEGGVSAKSNLVAEFIKHVTANLNKRAGVLNIVEALEFIKRGVPSASERKDVSQRMYLDTNLFSKVKADQKKILGYALKTKV